MVSAIVNSYSIWTGVGIACAAAAVLLMFDNQRRLQDSEDRVERTYQLTAHLDTAVASLTAAEAAARGFVASGDARFIESFEKDVTVSYQELAEASKLARASATDALFPDAERAFHARIAQLREGIGLAKTEGVDLSGLHVAITDGIRLMSFVHDSVAAIRDSEEGLLQQARADSKDAEEMGNVVMAGVVGTMVLLVAGTGFFARRAIRVQAIRDEENRRFRQLIDATGEAIVGLGRDRTFRSWSKGAERLFGYTADEVLGKTPSLLVPPDRQDETHGNFFASARSGIPVEGVETVRRAKDGTLITVTLSVFEVAGEAGDDLVVGAVLRDRRAELAAAEALRASELARKLERDLLDAIVENSSMAIFVKDADGRYLLVNREWERITGISRDQVLGHLDVEVLSPELGARARIRQEEVLSAAVPREHEEPVTTADGDERIYATTRVPLLGPCGKVERICGFANDVTLMRRLQDATEAARQSAESANQAKSEFLSRMSHELRTPLNVILGFAQVMQMEPRNPGDEEAIDHILRAGRHLLNLIDEVLDLSRVESNHMPLSIEPMDAAEMVAEVLGLVRPLANERRISLAFDQRSTIVHVLADRQRIKQVMLNLLSNAVKYNREAGAVTVSFAPTAAGHLRIEVTDTGMGIRHERMSHLFQPFERLGAEATNIQGTGLGLAISKRLVEAMAGRIGATSEIGAGSTFWIEVPLADPSEREHPVGDPVAAAIPAGETSSAGVILYIEDNLANLSLVERVLTRRPGIRLIAAMQGRMGIDLAREHRPNLIILDLHLPDMTGEAVLYELQADPATRDIPVVVASADATVGTIERLGASGVSGFLTKPLDIRLFLETVDRVMGGS